MSTEPRHILGLSGGKDSAALAIFMRDRIPQMEYFFCDTGEELQETYEYLIRLEAYLGKPIARLNAGRDFGHYLKIYGGYLPSAKMRWCTRQLKIKPLEDWVGDASTISYVGLRADEDRDGYISTKPNITALFPFRDAGLIKEDIFRILEESGVGIPKYYQWRSRSGCYFCFFQRRIEWIRLKEHHPDLYEKAKIYEKPGPSGQPGYTWIQGESLSDLEKPERIAEIKARHEISMEREEKKRKNLRLIDVFEEVIDAESDEQACLICTL